MENLVNWFEIPVVDFDRARTFYSAITEVPIETVNLMGMTMGMFTPADEPAGGAIVKSDFHKPSTDGIVVYLNGNPDLNIMLNKVADAGGLIVMHKTQIAADFGFMAFFIDSEGNKIALHSKS
jgi:hypothetical protein